MTKSNRKGWRRVLIGVVVGLAAVALVIVAVILLTGGSGNSELTTASGVTLEEWLGGTLSTRSFNGTWLSGKSRRINRLPA